MSEICNLHLYLAGTMMGTHLDYMEKLLKCWGQELLNIPTRK